MRRILIAASFGVLTLALAAPAHAAARASGRLGTIVVLNGRTVIAADQVTSSVVVFHGRTIVEGHATGSVVVFDGATRISGDVDDSVVVFRGRVEVTDGAHIGGDLITNGDPVVATGARIDGSRKHVSNFQLTSYSFLVRVLLWLAYSVSILVLGLLMVALLPGPMESAARATARMGASIGWGFAILFGLPVVTLLALVTVVGIPLALSLLFALWFLFTAGYTVGVYAIGRMLVKPPRGRMKAFLAGWGVLRVIGVIPVLGGIVWTIVSMIGLGAVTLAVWHSRRAVRDAERAPAASPPVPAEGS